MKKKNTFPVFESFSLLLILVMYISLCEKKTHLKNVNKEKDILSASIIQKPLKILLKELTHLSCNSYFHFFYFLIFHQINKFLCMS